MYVYILCMYICIIHTVLTYVIYNTCTLFVCMYIVCIVYVVCVYNYYNYYNYYVWD